MGCGGPTLLFPGSCLTSASPHPAPTWPAWTATFGTKMEAVLDVHNPSRIYPVGNNEDLGDRCEM